MRSKLDQVNGVKGREQYLYSHLRFTDLGQPTLNTADGNIAKKPIPFVLTNAKKAKEGKSGLNKFDEFEDG